MHVIFFFSSDQNAPPQPTKTFSPEKTPEMQPGNVMAGMRLSITQVSVYVTDGF